MVSIHFSQHAQTLNVKFFQVSGEMDGNHVTGDQGHDQGYVFPWSDQDTSGVQVRTLNKRPKVYYFFLNFFFTFTVIK